MTERNLNYEGTSNPSEKNAMGTMPGIHPALYGKVTLPVRSEQPMQAEVLSEKSEPQKRRTVRRAAKKADSEKALMQGHKETKPAPSRGKKRGQNGGGKKPSIRIYFLGGLNEIGKNFTLYECEGDMMIVDCGMSFPDDDMLGVDLVLPDFTFVAVSYTHLDVYKRQT